jgi:energy-coupling factor transporter ATP-binding protein EcfA2
VSSFFCYSLYGLDLVSDIKLKGLTPCVFCDSKKEKLFLKTFCKNIDNLVHASGFFIPEKDSDFSKHLGLDGRKDVSISKQTNGYLIKIGEAFFATWQKEVMCLNVYLEEEMDASIASHLIIDHLVPLIQSSLGKLVIHASVVECDNGKTVALIGESGMGKSTLSAYFASRGRTIIADDVLVLDTSVESELVVCGGNPSIRLTKDSIAGLNIFTEVDSTGKGLIHLDEQGLYSSGASIRKLDAIFFLEVDSLKVSIEQVAGVDAFIRIVKNLFCLDIDTARLNFLQIASLFKNVGMWYLFYPRDFLFLPEVLNVVEKELENVRNNS